MINFLGNLLFLFMQLVLGLRTINEYQDILSAQQLPPAHKKQTIYRLIAPGYMLIFEVGQVLEKGSQCEYSFGRFFLIITAPIPLRADDVISVDSRNGKVEIVERQGIVIWRAAWAN